MSNLNTYLGSLRDSESDELLSGNMRGISIFAIPCMSILTTYSDSPLKIKFNEPNFINMQEFSIFSSMPCKVAHGIHAELTLRSFWM
jgi:hypothetical protein